MELVVMLGNNLVLAWQPGAVDSPLQSSPHVIDGDKVRMASCMVVMLVSASHVMQIFVLSSSRIQQRGYDTLFKYTTGNPKSGVARLVKKAPPKAQVKCIASICPCSVCKC